MKKINGSVGQKGTNVSSDVKLVKTLLNRVKYKPTKNKLIVTGQVGNDLIDRIKLFQKDFVKISNPNGLIEPGDKTFKKLNESSAEVKIGTHLTFSAKGINLLQVVEQLELKPYDDHTGKEVSEWVDGATIGYGHYILKNEWGSYKDGITKVQSVALFKKDLQPFINRVKTKVRSDITQNEFDALVILAFNIGVGGFSSSSVLKLVNNPLGITPYSSIEDAWKAWNRSEGKIMNGLIKRRQCEWDIYSKAVYKRW